MASRPEVLSGLEWRLLEDRLERSPHAQMALDEALLESVAAGRRGPTLRFWEWAAPALVIGSHQSVTDEVDTAEAERAGFTVTRRMSGGGTMIVEPGRTITYSLYLPQAPLQPFSFVESFALLDSWAVEAFQRLGIEASYRPVNDIVSPRGKIAGAAQARRRGSVLHHTTAAHSMDVRLVRRLIRIGRPALTGRGLRSAEKEVSPLEWFTDLGPGAVTRAMAAHFQDLTGAGTGRVTGDEEERARELERVKYSRPDWIHRLP